jgi:hypothetical protein
MDKARAPWSAIRRNQPDGQAGQEFHAEANDAAWQPRLLRRHKEDSCRVGSAELIGVSTVGWSGGHRKVTDQCAEASLQRRRQESARARLPRGPA